MWINEHEIDQALDVVGRYAPEYLPYVKYLSDWRETINRNSDGWPYWTAGTRCASKLMELTSQLMNALRDRGTRPTVKEFAKALPSVKSCATRHKLPAPVLGEEYADVIKDDMEFVAWIEETLIPDLKDSGTVETARDFERLVRIIKRLSGS
jgi:hypothetical protein